MGAVVLPFGLRYTAVCRLQLPLCRSSADGREHLDLRQKKMVIALQYEIVAKILRRAIPSILLFAFYNSSTQDPSLQRSWRQPHVPLDYKPSVQFAYLYLSQLAKFRGYLDGNWPVTSALIWRAVYLAW